MTQREAVYIIIPVYNRKATTLHCLSQLQQQGDLDRFEVIVVDDGSTDGTAAAIQAHYPSVIVLPGNGNLWWTGAIAYGMQYAYTHGAAFFVWLNDDTLPSPNAIASLVQACKDNPQTITSAQCYATAELKEPTYGGKRKAGLKHLLIAVAPPESALCDSLHGNVVCIPRAVVDRIGYPPTHQVPHYHGDSVYTWKAKQAGYQLTVLGWATAVCAKNPGDPSWLLSDFPIWKRWQSFLSPKSPFYIPGFWRFCLAFWGPVGTLVFVQPYIRLAVIWALRILFPRPVLHQLKAQRSVEG